MRATDALRFVVPPIFVVFVIVSPASHHGIDYVAAACGLAVPSLLLVAERLRLRG